MALEVAVIFGGPFGRFSRVAEFETSINMVTVKIK